MVCCAPEPPEGSRDLPIEPHPDPPFPVDDDSEDELYYYEGYEPLPQAPNEDYLSTWSSSVMSESDDEEAENTENVDVEMIDVPQTETDIAQPPPGDVPNIESVEREIVREVWAAPREQVNIEMNQQRAREVMLAMADFTLPASAYPEWARCVSEEEWKQQLAKRTNT